MFLLLLGGDYSNTHLYIVVFCFDYRWLFGDFGCQLYAFVGFHIGIGLIFSLGLVIVDGYQFARGKYLVS